MYISHVCVHIYVSIDKDTRPNSKKVAYGSIAHSHNESAQDDWVLPASLVRDAMTTHWKKETQECNNDGQHGKTWYEWIVTPCKTSSVTSCMAP